MTMKIQHSKIYFKQQSQFQKEVYSNTSLPQETNKQNFSNKQSNLTPKGTKKRTNKAQCPQKERNNKDKSGNK